MRLKAAITVGSMILVGIGWVKVKMLPFDNKSEFQVILNMPEGSSLERTARAAREMAAGALAASRASVAVAVTGIAGPSGGSAEKPIGMVCFSWALRDRVAKTETCRFAGDRGEVRRRSVIRALQGLIEVLDEVEAQD